jgi:hypothetical protein
MSMPLPIRRYRLVPRGKAGLTCDDDGIAFGPITLVEPVHVDGEKISYQCISQKAFAKAINALCGGTSTTYGARLYARLGAIAELMSIGQHSLARIAAVQMAFPELASEPLEELSKFNPNWPEQPRDDHGRWSGDGMSPVIPVIAPYTRVLGNNRCGDEAVHR